MGKNKITIITAALCALISASYANEISTLKEGFETPPDSAKPFTWWHWMNGNISESGIVKDLTAMKETGLGGFHLFTVAPSETAKGKVKYGTPEWNSAFTLAAQKAEALGLDFAFHNCAGFATTAGPAITPEYAMQQLVWTSLRVNPGAKNPQIKKFTVEENKEVPLVFSINGCQPEPHPDKVKWQNEFYTDVAVLAFPTPADEKAESVKPFRLEDWPLKSGYGRQEHFYTNLFPEPDKRAAPHPIKLEDIIDLTSKMSADGTLDWTPPDNRQWTLMRFGYTITGMQNHPAPEGSRGLECDKFSKDAIRFHFAHNVKPILDLANGGGQKRLKALLIDSYEAREQNWTKLMPQEFKARRGYDITKYLPAFAGRVINSTLFTERFLFDMRRTCADMIAENHYAEFTKLCHENNVLSVLEPYGGPSPMDSVQSALTADLLMGEFWTNRTAGRSDLSVKIAASVSDLRGKSIVGAESFTAGRGQKSFEDHPAIFKKQGDYFFTYGLTRTIFHCYAHQPFADSMKPGMSMWVWGSQMHRNNTWWGFAKPWFQYVARAQYILQHGKTQVDIALFYGRNAPSTLSVNIDGIDKSIRQGSFTPMPLKIEGFPIMPEGYDFHVLNDTLIFELTNGGNGDIVHKSSGTVYKLLIVRKEDCMDIDVLKHILNLVKNGATVMMEKPVRTAGLTNFPAADEELKALADAAWQSGTPAKYGKGKIYPADFEPSKVFAQTCVKQDFAFEAKSQENSADEKIYIRYIHKKTDDAEVYFVANLSDVPARLNMTFRAEASALEIWDAETGTSAPAPVWKSNADGTTFAAHNFEKGESKFFVLKRGAKAAAHSTGGIPAGGELLLNKGALYLKTFEDASMLDLSKDWTLSFPKESGCRQNISLPKLISWTEFENFDEKHFSGTALYERTFELPQGALPKDGGIVLNLGKVRIIAKLEINGQDAGILWKEPFNLDVTKFLKEGQNTIKIWVASTFTNRLAGDAELPDDAPARDKAYPDWAFDDTLPRPQTGRKTFYSFEYVKKGTPLTPAGLLGPVELKPYVLRVFDEGLKQN